MTDDERCERYAAAIDDVGYIGDAFPAVLDAAMAVADYEHELIREAAEFHQKRYMEADADNARLRAERTEMSQNYMEAVESRNEDRATIARVRSVLDNYRPEPFGPMLSDAIRAALEGEQS